MENSFNMRSSVPGGRCVGVQGDSRSERTVPEPAIEGEESPAAPPRGKEVKLTTLSAPRRLVRSR